MSNEERNKMFAEFMEFYESGKDPVWKNIVMVAKDGQSSYVIGEMNYRTSWDWLMPVVEKIQTIENGRYHFTIDPWGIEMIDYKNGEESIFNIQDEPNQVEIEKYYDAASQFLQWYNQQSK